MSVAFDASILLPLLFPGVRVPINPATKQPIEHCRERIDQLISELDKTHTKIIIPTPVLSEILVHADSAGPKYLEQLRQSRAFKLEPFDERAAVEVAMMIRSDLRKLGKKRGRQSQETWAKVKFDQQIVAIAKVNGASTIYSDDNGVRTFAAQAGLTTIGLLELSIPDSAGQMDLFQADSTRVQKQEEPDPPDALPNLVTTRKFKILK